MLMLEYHLPPVTQAGAEVSLGELRRSLEQRGDAMSKQHNVATELNEYLKELHLPRRATQETLSYEQFLLELVEQECQERRAHRIEQLLRSSRLPLDKTLSNFDLKRLPTKAAR